MTTFSDNVVWTCWRLLRFSAQHPARFSFIFPAPFNIFPNFHQYRVPEGICNKKGFWAIFEKSLHKGGNRVWTFGGHVVKLASLICRLILQILEKMPPGLKIKGNFPWNRRFVFAHRLPCVGWFKNNFGVFPTKIPTFGDFSGTPTTLEASPFLGR